MDKKESIERIPERIKNKYKLEKIILFDSFAWRDPSNNSDIDLLIIKKTKRGFRQTL